MSRGKLAPETSVSIVRVKKRPRGKSFEAGNGFGAKHRFKPGQSGNISGRPLCREVNAASREYLGSETRKSPHVRTNAQAIIREIGRKAKKGDLGAATFLANRAEGLPVQGLSINNENDPLKTLCDFMAQESAVIGRPEGFIPRQKVLEVSSGND